VTTLYIRPVQTLKGAQMDIPEIVFKLAVCVFMIVTIIRETNHYRFLQKLENQLRNRDAETNSAKDSLKG
jgi:hypothetical protein